MGTFTWPIAFLGLLAVPVLVGIYLLRSRYRPHSVSSLLLWQGYRKPRQGGRHIERLQAPLLFILELLAILLIVLAATGPLIRSGRQRRVVTVVLDNSYSMLAGGDQNARSKATAQIRDYFSGSGDFAARFILAGDDSRLIGSSARDMGSVDDMLAEWKCDSVTADLANAVTFANKVSSQAARILIVTDHKPEDIPQNGRIEYWAFGEPLANLAITEATRSRLSGRDRCLVAVTNFADTDKQRTLYIEAAESGNVLTQRQLNLKPRQTERIFFEPNEGLGPLRIRLAGEDSLATDNQALLAPHRHPHVRVKIDITDEQLHELTTKAVRAAGATITDLPQSQLLITDSNTTAAAAGNSWPVTIISEPNSKAYLGPFIMDNRHPLMEGLAFESVVWGGSSDLRLRGEPVIWAGNVTLVSDEELPGGIHHITMNLNTRRSTLQQSINWPVFFYNLIDWRRKRMPGLDRYNVAAGSQVTLTTSGRMSQQQITLTAPDGSRQQLEPIDRELIIEATQPGIYRLKTPDREFAFAANLMRYRESDISNADNGRWGQWAQARLYWWEYKPVDWLLVLAAMGLLTAHSYVSCRIERGPGV